MWPKFSQFTLRLYQGLIITGHDHLSKEITSEAEHNIIYVSIFVISVIITSIRILMGLYLYIVFITKLSHFNYIVPCAQTRYGSKSATAHAILPSLN